MLSMGSLRRSEVLCRGDFNNVWEMCRPGFQHGIFWRRRWVVGRFAEAFGHLWKYRLALGEPGFNATMQLRLT